MKRGLIATLTLCTALGCGDDDGDGAVGQVDASMTPVMDAMIADEAGDAASPDDEDLYPEVTCSADIPASPITIDRAGETGKARAKVLKADYDPPRKYYNDWVIKLSDASGAPLTDAKFSNVMTFMPVHGHNGRYKPVVTPDAEPGVYKFDGVHFTMTGPWQLRFAVSAGSLQENFTLDVCVGD